jgi:FkbM family methyltransferase
MRRLAELGFPSGRNITNTKHGFKFQVDRLDAIKWYIHYFGEFEPQISLAWKRILKPGNTVVDIGGNVGYHALLAAQCVGPEGRVFTFEPASKNFRDLMKNIALNHMKNIYPQEVAISDRAGEVKIHYAGDNEQGSSSIVRGFGEGRSVKAIDFSRISEYTPIEEIDLIKIDVEGAEPLVIKGMLPIMDRLHPQCAIFIEVGSEHAGLDLLRPFFANGFEARRIANEYSTNFYRKESDRVDISEFKDAPGILQDVILAKDPQIFNLICE